MHPLALTDNIRILTAHITARRFNLENERMHMSRLSEKLAHARGVVGRQTARIEAKADAIIAREPLIEKQTDEAFAMHEAMLKEAEQGLDTLARELALVSNDPLASSGASPPEPPRFRVEMPQPLPPAPPPDVVHTFEIALQQPEPQLTPQDPARAMVR